MGRIVCFRASDAELTGTTTSMTVQMQLQMNSCGPLGAEIPPKSCGSGTHSQSRGAESRSPAPGAATGRTCLRGRSFGASGGARPAVTAIGTMSCGRELEAPQRTWLLPVGAACHRPSFMFRGDGDDGAC